MTACFCGVDVTGVTDSVLFMERKPVGVIKAKRADHLGHRTHPEENHRLPWAAQQYSEQYLEGKIRKYKT